MSDSLRPLGLQHTRLPCPSRSSGSCSNSCPLSRWCHPTISSSVIPFSCLQSFPTSGSFSVSRFLASGGQSIGVSASASVLPMNLNIQDWFPLGWTVWISLQSRGLSQVFSSTTIQKINSSALSFLYGPPLMTTGKTIALTRQTFVEKVMSLLFNMPSMLVIAFLPRSKCLWISKKPKEEEKTATRKQLCPTQQTWRTRWCGFSSIF